MNLRQFGQWPRWEMKQHHYLRWLNQQHNAHKILYTRTLHYAGFIEIINLFAPELFFLILAHPVYKTWKIQEPNMYDLWNKLDFEEEKTESIYHV